MKIDFTEQEAADLRLLLFIGLTSLPLAYPHMSMADLQSVDALQQRATKLLRKINNGETVIKDDGFCF